MVAMEMDLRAPKRRLQKLFFMLYMLCVDGLPMLHENRLQTQQWHRN